MTPTSTTARKDLYPWSESGIELLNNLALWVNIQGGNDKLSHLIEVEWIKSGKRLSIRHEPVNRPDLYSEVDTAYVMANYNKIPTNEIANNIGRSNRSVERRWQYIKAKEKTKSEWW